MEAIDRNWEGSIMKVKVERLDGPFVGRACRTCARKIGNDCPARARSENAKELRRQKKVYGYCPEFVLIYDPDWT